MQTMTLEQLQVAQDTGDVVDIVLRDERGGFVVEVQTRDGGDFVLAGTGSNEPRRFASLAAAAGVLYDNGISVEWNTAAAATCYNEWLAGELRRSLDDPRPNVPHIDVMRDLDAVMCGQPINKVIR